MLLEKNAVYQAILDVPFFATENMIRSHLEDAGFTNITFLNVDGVKGVQGTWSCDNQEVSIPSQLKRPRRVGTAQ